MWETDRINGETTNNNFWVISGYTNIKSIVKKMIGMSERENKYIENINGHLSPTNVCVSIWTNENTYRVLGQQDPMSYRI